VSPPDDFINFWPELSSVQDWLGHLKSIAKGDLARPTKENADVQANSARRDRGTRLSELSSRRLKPDPERCLAIQQRRQRRRNTGLRGRNSGEGSINVPIVIARWYGFFETERGHAMFKFIPALTIALSATAAAAQYNAAPRFPGPPGYPMQPQYQGPAPLQNPFPQQQQQNCSAIQIGNMWTIHCQ
jgi:hypothetical protein